MSKRLQVVVADPELASFREAAAQQGLTLSEWVRRTLHAARRDAAGAGSERKIDSIRSAARHHFPAPDIETMLAEIEHGYGPPPHDL